MRAASYAGTPVLARGQGLSFCARGLLPTPHLGKHRLRERIGSRQKAFLKDMQQHSLTHTHTHCSLFSLSLSLFVCMCADAHTHTCLCLSVSPSVRAHTHKSHIKASRHCSPRVLPPAILRHFDGILDSTPLTILILARATGISSFAAFIFLFPLSSASDPTEN